MVRFFPYYLCNLTVLVHFAGEAWCDVTGATSARAGQVGRHRTAAPSRTDTGIVSGGTRAVTHRRSYYVSVGSQ